MSELLIDLSPLTDRQGEVDTSWIYDPIKEYNAKKWSNRFLFHLFRLLYGKEKATYLNLYVTLLLINGKDDPKVKKTALERIVNIYKDNHNGEAPKGFESNGK